MGKEENIDELMQDVFGTTADEEYLDTDDDREESDDVEQDSNEEDEEETEEQDESSELADEDEELLRDDEEEDDEEEIDDTDEDDDSDVGDDDGESEPDGDQDEGDGADETLSDGLMALDMMVDQRAASYVPEKDEFDPTVVGSEDAFIKDAKETFGDEFDEAYAVKMGKLAYKSAVRQAKQRHEASAEDRMRARRDRDTARITAEVQQLGAKAPDELTRVEARMARIYQQKIDRYGVDAANQIPVEVYFRLAGGRLAAPKQTPQSKEGVASRQAKAQKRKAVKAQRRPDQIGRVRSGKKKAKKDEAFEQLNAHLSTHKQIEDFFFGD